MWLRVTIIDSSVSSNGNVVQTTCQSPLDVVFLIDVSDSMLPNLNSSIFVFDDILRSYYFDRDVQIGVATFGGPPSLILPLIPKKKVHICSTKSKDNSQNLDTQDTKNLVSRAFQWVLENAGTSKGFFGNQRSGLEAIRMVVANNSGSDFRKLCLLTTFCKLNWRLNAERLVMMITDDSSDLPTQP